MADRTLTADDVKAIVDEIERRATERFQINVGRGVLGLLWKMAIYLMIAVAAFGAGGGLKKLF